MEDDDDELYGPPLPPGFKQSAAEESDEEKFEKGGETDCATIGPQCPVGFLKRRHSNGKNSSEKSSSPDTVERGVLPSVQQRDSSSNDESDSEGEYGPMPAQHSCDDGIDDVIGNIEKRAKDMKQKLTCPEVHIEKPKREEWMTVPNTSSRNQLGAISRCLSGNSSSSSSKHEKPHKHKEHSGHSREKREKSNSKEVAKAKKSKHSKSLLEMHQEKQKKKHKKESSKPKERKAFDRDAELSVRLMSKEQVDSVIKKSKFLDSRFSSGASQYL